MTEIKCDMTGCKHNSSCCSSPNSKADTFCTKDKVYFYIDEEVCQLECSGFEEDHDKAIECNKCQMIKYGGIKIKRENIKFE